MDLGRYGWLLLTLLCALLPHASLAAETGASETKADKATWERFKKLAGLEWRGAFADPCTGDWKKRWHLDGRAAAVRTGKDGMHFAAGPGRDDHAVLWTRARFAGDLKIEYDYTRTDRATTRVNIIYIEATGSGKGVYAKDIFAWSRLRAVALMKHYFQNMKLFHVSYAAFNNDNKDPRADYVRARRYACGPLKGTELRPDYFRTGLFATGVKHHITVPKTDRELFMRVQNGKQDRLFRFLNDRYPPLEPGPVGLRHMATRSARYRDVRVCERRAVPLIPSKP